MKTHQQINEEIEENRRLDAEELVQRMFSFISIKGEGVTNALISAKFCAKVACDYLIDNLPNINETAPINRLEEQKYKQYWMGVKGELDKIRQQFKEQGYLYSNGKMIKIKNQR